VFQDGGSYLHDIRKNGTADKDHVLSSRRKVFFNPTCLASCTSLLFQSLDPKKQIVLRLLCFQDDGSYLHDVSKNGTADEDHVLPPRRILDADLKLGEPLHVTLSTEKIILTIDATLQLHPSPFTGYVIYFNLGFRFWSNEILKFLRWSNPV
jgi:hypothetical protein